MATNEYKNNNIEKNQLSDLGADNSIRDAHNKEEHALDVIKANSLIPKRYQKIELSYITGTECDIETILYYGNGERFAYDINVRENPMGTTEKTAVSFFNILPSTLDGKFLKIYDDAGSIGVWFNLNSSSLHPTTGCLRDIEVPISSGDGFATLANKLELAMQSDSEFLASRMDSITVISSISVGNKSDASSETSGLIVSITQGVDSLNGQYFITYSAEDEIKYYIWYNINSTGVDPAVVGAIGIEVSLNGTETPEQVAQNTASAVNANKDFKSGYKSNTIEIENYKVGMSSDYETGTASFEKYIVIKDGRDLEVIARLDFTYDGNGNMKTVQGS